MSSTQVTADAYKMLPQERRSAAWLASIYALRMFGMFMILPVFAEHAKLMPDGDRVSLVGLAMGIYGLTQAVMQIPLGWASDRLGRKPVIVGGLLVFALGCWMGFVADTVFELLIARSLQGAGAISAALSAYLADVTRDEVRSKGMAMIGASIGVTFAISLVAAPVLYQWIGLDGLFGMTGALSLAAIAAVLFRLPSVPENASPTSDRSPAGIGKVLLHRDLMRLNLGIFVLHLTQMSLFLVVPSLLISELDLPLQAHWKVYLPVVLVSFLAMVPLMVWGERQARTRQIKLGAILLMICVIAGFLMFSKSGWALVGLLWLYFVAFNLLEATLPSWVSRVAPSEHRGLALGVYNTSQALGLFAGGALGGAIQASRGIDGVFEVILVCMLLWLIAARGIKALPRRPQTDNPTASQQTVKI